MSWAISRATVDLPDPDSPTMAVTRPRRRATSTSSTACTALTGAKRVRTRRLIRKCFRSATASNTTSEPPGVGVVAVIGGPLRRLQVQEDVQRVRLRRLCRRVLVVLVGPADPVQRAVLATGVGGTRDQHRSLLDVDLLQLVHRGLARGVVRG